MKRSCRNVKGWSVDGLGLMILDCLFEGQSVTDPILDKVSHFR